MMNLPQQLNRIPHIKHAIYVDDVTIWTNSGSDGAINDALQEAANVVQEYVRHNGLTCSPTKSELLIIRNKAKKTPDTDTQQQAPIKIVLESGPVPPVLTIRVLGMLIQHNTQNTAALTKLQNTAKQICGLLRRVANRHRGMKEMDLCRLIQAFLISRIVYSFPYYHLRK